MGGYIVVTVTTNNPVTFSYDPDDFLPEESDQPALLRKTLHEGESAVFVNEGSADASVLSSADADGVGAFDFVVYHADGTLEDYDYDATNEVEVPAGGRVVVTTTTNEPVTFGGAYTLFTATDSDEPALQRVTLREGENYVFVNLTDRSQRIGTNASSREGRLFDYATYKSDETGYGLETGDDTASLVPEGGYQVVTALSDSVTFIYHPAVFRGEASEEPALLKKELGKGESYRFFNLSGESLTLYTDGSTTKKFDYVVYEADGTIKKQETDSSADPSIPGNGWIVVTTVTDNPVTFYGYYNLLVGNETGEPALERIALQKGDSYLFRNTSDSSQRLKTDASSSMEKMFDYAIYNADGTAYRTMTGGWQQVIASTRDPSSVPAGGTIVVTVVSDNPVTFIYSSQFAAEESEEPALLRVTLLKGEQYTFTNTGTQDLKLNKASGEGLQYEYISYHADGTVAGEGRTYNEPTVPAGGWIEVTSLSDNPITFGVFYRLFEGGERETIDWQPLELHTPIDLSGEADETFYFSFVPGQTGMYRFFTEPYQGTGSENDTVLTLYEDASLHSEVEQNDNVDGPYGSRFSKIEAWLQANQTYYLLLRHADSAGFVHARLTVEEDFDGTRETARAAEWDEIYTDQLSSLYDVDYYKLHLDELADIHLIVTANVVVLEDANGNTLETFRAGDTSTVFSPTMTGVYYAKVYYEQANIENSTLGTNTVASTGPIGYSASYKHIVRQPNDKPVVATPGKTRGVTFRWNFLQSHDIVYFKVYDQNNTLVYEDMMTDVVGQQNYTFTWNGEINRTNGNGVYPGVYYEKEDRYFARDGKYTVKVVAHDAPQWPLVSEVQVKNVVPVILVPGIGGSQLYAVPDDLVWVAFWDVGLNEPVKEKLSLKPVSEGSTEVISENGVDVFALQTNYGLDGISRLTLLDLFENARQYKKMIEALQNEGYIPGVSLFGLPYDWRMDLRTRHLEIERKINEAISASGSSKVNIIAHSMGGLLIKDYLLLNPGKQQRIDTFITIGTPFLGAPLASKALAFGGYNFNIPFMYESTGHEIAKYAPSVYELAPSREYERVMNQAYGRSTFLYIDRTGETRPIYDMLSDLYPYQPLVDLAEDRHILWDRNYPNVKQYHIVGDNVPTVIGFNQWQIPNDVVEYVLGNGDGTVPRISGENPGKDGARVFYANTTSGHLELLKETPVIRKVLDILNGIPYAPVPGIVTSPSDNSIRMQSYSFTGEVDGLVITVRRKNTNEVVRIEVGANGEVDQSNLPQDIKVYSMKLADQIYNIQVIVDLREDLEVTAQSPQDAQIDFYTYKIEQESVKERKFYQTITPKAPLHIQQEAGQLNFVRN
ncbi:lipase/acyltransferase domain-containing protein [Brevibacillus marinus]|uniref:lipase/acyltransferase domain-containing protein n=1 Tax=Brevibacillus marinus TaxID=2496837 RepID=UPI000F826A87|nr:hypothetical protein [Brevibacillus marinus]